MPRRAYSMANNLAKVVKGGDRRAALEALRDRLAQELDECEYTRDLPALALRLTDVLAQLDDLPPASGGGAADVIAARRRQRRAQRG